MADTETKTPIITPAKLVLTEQAATDKLNKQIAFYEQYIGKRGCNPYFAIGHLNRLAADIRANLDAITDLPEPTEAEAVVDKKAYEAAKANTTKPIISGAKK